MPKVYTKNKKSELLFFKAIFDIYKLIHDDKELYVGLGFYSGSGCVNTITVISFSLSGKNTVIG